MGRTAVRLDANLDAVIAEHVMKPRVDDALSMLHDSARAKAPACRVWISMRDNLVRDSHIKADGQVIPTNLRFKVPKVDGSGHDLARFPRDPNLPIGNRINCRCEDPTLPQPLRDSIKRTAVTVVGTRVSGQVYTEFPRAAESEFGTSEDKAARFMTQALTEVAARLQSGQRR